MNLGKPIAQGNTAKIYLSDNKIIKVFNDHLSDSEPIKEQLSNKLLTHTGYLSLKLLM